MLDLNNPQSEHIFAAAKLEDAVLEGAKRMVHAESSTRQVLLASCRETLTEMHRLNSEHFGNSPFITNAIDQRQDALSAIAESAQPNTVTIHPALALLPSDQGFKTMWIYHPQQPQPNKDDLTTKTRRHEEKQRKVIRTTN